MDTNNPYHRSEVKPMGVEAMPETAVYQFIWSDRHTGKDVVSLRFATLEAITRCNGKPIETSRRMVDSRQVDRNGFYFISSG